MLSDWMHTLHNIQIDSTFTIQKLQSGTIESSPILLYEFGLHCQGARPCNAAKGWSFIFLVASGPCCFV